MKLIVAFCLLSLSMAMGVYHHEERIADESWHLWKGRHGKAYTDIHEEKVRYAIWQDNLRRIIEHNSQNHGFTLKMNHFGDMTNYEFRRQMNGYIMRTGNRTGSTFLSASNVQPPDTVDWRTKGYVTPVKNQAQCGSCWAFSTTGSLEGQHFKKTGKLVSLSEQQLVDCDRKSGDQGCNGGLMDNAFRYIEENGGIDTEQSYPYKGRNGRCKFKKKHVGAYDTGYIDLTSGDEGNLKIAVATTGPISVAIDASHSSFQFYNSGVYNERRCSPKELDHGVLVVGYGTENGKDYWLVKNSWGENWGLQGYIKMSRNQRNQCGIATQASYPIVQK